MTASGIACHQLPRTIIGAGAVLRLEQELSALGIDRPLLVTDAGVVRAGIAHRVNKALTIRKPVAMLDNVTENPLFADADRGADAYLRHGCDGVIALGGGSVIDTAKYIALLANNGGSVEDYAGKPDARHRRCAPLAVLPTTAGTGSEASPDAGIHPDADTASTGMSSHAIIPHLALLDPDLTITLPSRLTAATGIDAISHCIEAYFARSTSPFTDALALDGIARAVNAIGVATQSGHNIEARTDMMMAAYAGGVGIGMGLGPAHAIAITCGDQGFQHGILSGIGLVCSIDLVSRHEPIRAAAVARSLGISVGGTLATAIATLMRSLDLPATLKELGYQAGNIAQIAAAAHASPFNMSARHHPSTEVYATMLSRSLDGMIGDR